MVTERVRVDSLAAGQEHLARTDQAAGSVLVVPVERVVPTWLAALVAAARSAGAHVVVDAPVPADLDGEAAAGWEIGVCTAAFAAGVDGVTGIDHQRIARVRELTVRLDAARPEAGTEGAS